MIQPKQRGYVPIPLKEILSLLFLGHLTLRFVPIFVVLIIVIVIIRSIQ